jgi:hypothetical protein
MIVSVVLPLALALACIGWPNPVLRPAPLRFEAEALRSVRWGELSKALTPGPARLGSYDVEIKYDRNGFAVDLFDGGLSYWDDLGVGAAAALRDLEGVRAVLRRSNRTKLVLRPSPGPFTFDEERCVLRIAKTWSFEPDRRDPEGHWLRGVRRTLVVDGVGLADGGR